MRTKRTNKNGTPGKPEELIVEKIFDRHVRQGKVEYLLKLSYGDSENTWEPEDNLDCAGLMPQLRSRRRKQKAESQPIKMKGGAVTRSRRKKKGPRVAKPRGLDRGLDPERIIGATDIHGELEFVIKWKDCDVADLVTARVANVRWPHVVIAFYEEHLDFAVEEQDTSGKVAGG